MEHQFVARGWDGTRSPIFDTYTEARQWVREYLAPWMQDGDSIAWAHPDTTDNLRLAWVTNELGEDTDPSASINNAHRTLTDNPKQETTT